MRGEPAADYVGIGRTLFYELVALDRLPAPIELRKGFKLWARRDLDEWVRLGCPFRTDFEERREAPR